MRKSTINTLQDSAGNYEQEIFDCENPKRVIIGIHGKGVRRWDGEEFFYQVADEFSDSVLLLVDQNQPENEGVRMNSISTIVRRNQDLIDLANTNYPNLPIWVISHSMGCGINALLDLSKVKSSIFVAPTIDDEQKKLKSKIGPEIVNGKATVNNEGQYVNFSKIFYDSCEGIIWQDEYSKMLANHANVHVFESEDEEIVSELRFILRDYPFASYTIIEGAKHNYSGDSSVKLFNKIHEILNKN